MFDLKNLADFLTIFRGSLAVVLVWLGLSQGKAGLGVAFWFMLADWTSDILDGFFARRSKNPTHTWIGDHDLEVDILVSSGLLIYMLLSGIVVWQIGLGYLLFWIYIFKQWGYNRSLGMLLQAPIYGWFIIVSIKEVPGCGWWFLGWILAVVIITWPRFPEQVVPEFLEGIHLTRKGS